jgi:hypothetical protein
MTKSANPTQGPYDGEYDTRQEAHTRQTVNRVGENDNVAKKQALTNTYLLHFCQRRHNPILMASMASMASMGQARQFQCLGGGLEPA